MLLLKGSGIGLYKETVAYDKGKPAARQGRKAVSLFQRGSLNFKLFRLRDCLVAEGNWKEPGLQNSPLLNSGDYSLQSCVSLFKEAASNISRLGNRSRILRLPKTIPLPSHLPSFLNQTT